MITSLTALTILFFLLPGVLGLLVFEQVVETRKERSQFDKIVIGAALALVSVAITNWAFMFLGQPVFRLEPLLGGESINEALGVPSGWPLAASTFVGCVIAILAAGIHNSGRIHGFLKWLKLTRETGRPDVWHDAFSTHRGVWVRLTFNDGRVLVGWPQYYSAGGAEIRELFLANAAWTFPAQREATEGEIKEEALEEEVTGPGVYVHNFDQVTSIEFLG